MRIPRASARIMFLTMILALLAVPVSLGQFVKVHAESFSCGEKDEALHLWMFVADDGWADCEEVGVGQFQCSNGSGDSSTADCTSCIETNGYAGCLALPKRQWTIYASQLSILPLYTVTCMDAHGNIGQTFEVTKGRNDTRCTRKTTGHGSSPPTLRGGCGYWEDPTAPDPVFFMTISVTCNEDGTGECNPDLTPEDGGTCECISGC